MGLMKKMFEEEMDVDVLKNRKTSRILEGKHSRAQKREMKGE